MFFKKKAPKLAKNYDYIIVGAGSAGCVLANRLSADERKTVLLIEAGKPDDWLVRMPAGAMAIAYHKNYSWMHRTAAMASLDGRSMHWPRGKVMGGSSSTNGMVYVRGQAKDYDLWAESGCPGWAWQDCLPYFKKVESFYLGESDTHGQGGLVYVQAAEADELGDRFIQACADSGLPLADDFNTGNNEGVGYYHVNIKNGRRQSTVECYLKPILHRSNLTVLTEAHVERIIFDGTRAVGVQFCWGGQRHSVTVDVEVLLSAGVINSPQLLQLSGVGDRALIKQNDIALVHHLPGVGENLQDHLAVMVAYEVHKPLTFKHKLKVHKLIHQLYVYWRYKRGLFNMPAGYIGAFFKSTSSASRPDMQLHFNPASGVRNDEGVSKLDQVAGVTTVVTPLHPESRGSVKITSSDPFAHPAIEPNYLATEKDRLDMLSAVRHQRRFFAARPISEIAGKEIRPGMHLQGDTELLDHIKQNCVTNYHPVGTCKMGIDRMAVVDTKLRVHGLQNVRVVDASVMPTLISGNTNAATMMIAERAAEMIL